MRGILIAIEGINGVGKSTQAMRLKKSLECMEYNAIYIYIYICIFLIQIRSPVTLYSRY
ncbi:pA240L [African swine fever virus]